MSLPFFRYATRQKTPDRSVRSLPGLHAGSDDRCVRGTRYLGEIS
jgi:hypothetical protein